MKEYQVSKRISDLRERAMKSVKTHKMIYGDYGWDYRQMLLFYEGWMMYNKINSDDVLAATTAMRRSYAEVYMYDNLPVTIFGDEEILGLPDLVGLSKEEEERFKELDFWYKKFAYRVPGRIDHMSPDYDKLICVGIEGILAEISENRKKIEGLPYAEWLEKTEYYDMCEMQLNALLRLEDKYAQKARSMGMEEAANRLERVPRGPAESFHDALQSIHFFSLNLRGLYQFGHPDRTLIELYRKDIKNGNLTEEQALELLDEFNLLYSYYTRPGTAIGYMLGGRYADGTKVENELTWMLLQSIRHTRMAYPGVALAVNTMTSDDLLEYAVKTLALGCSHPALFNDDVLYQAFLDSGKPAEHACEYTHTTCVEMTPCKRSGVWVTSPYYDCPMILNDILMTGEYDNLDSILEELENQINMRTAEGQKLQDKWQMERMRNGGESILVSCLMEDCLSRGKSIDQGGAIYNEVMPNYVGVSTVIDSLAAIKAIVFEQKKYKLNEYLDIVQNNYEGHEELREYVVHKCPHFGNNDSLTNELAMRIYKMMLDACKGLSTYRGSKVYPGAFSYMMHEEYGKNACATPDGRKAHEAYNSGCNPVSGRDVNGPTATVLSMTHWDDTHFLGGIANNISFNFDGDNPEKVRNVCSLIRVFMARKGMQMQVNSVSLEELEDALKNPEKHENLIVRIGGYSDFFVRQSSEMQKEIVNRTRHEL